MLWAALAALLALPASADEMPDPTRAHLRSLEATAVRLEREGNRGKQYEKVKEEIARIRREYRLSASPAWPDLKPAPNATAHAQAAEAERKAKAETKARAEAPARPVDPREKAKKEFVSPAEEELKGRQMFSRFYRSREEWQYAYSLQMQFAQKPLAAGGLGFDFSDADNWAKYVVTNQPPGAIEGFRRRYQKAIAYMHLPVEQGGPGYERGEARKKALELAQGSSDAQVEKWIGESRHRVLSERGGSTRFTNSCRSWYKAFGG